MMRGTMLACVLAMLGCSVDHWLQPAAAQNVHLSTPMVGVSDSFYEWYGIDWGYRWSGPRGNFFFQRGGSLGTAPPFGGFDPNQAARLGFSSGGFNFNFTAAQGSNRTITASTPSVTVANGAVGSIRDVQMRPFVTGLIPVVGSRSGGRVPPPTLISPLKARLARLQNEPPPQSPRPAPEQAVPRPPQPTPDAGELRLGTGTSAPELKLTGSGAAISSSAERGDISIAEIRRRQAADRVEAAAALQTIIDEARAAESVGRFGAARARYRQAAARASGDLKRELLERLEAIRDR